jgi:hypothetical protein
MLQIEPMKVKKKTSFYCIDSIIRGVPTTGCGLAVIAA